MSDVTILTLLSTPSSWKCLWLTRNRLVQTVHSKWFGIVATWHREIKIVKLGSKITLGAPGDYASSQQLSRPNNRFNIVLGVRASTGQT